MMLGLRTKDQVFMLETLVSEDISLADDDQESLSTFLSMSEVLAKQFLTCQIFITGNSWCLSSMKAIPQPESEK
jgi:hypothetical protein